MVQIESRVLLLEDARTRIEGRQDRMEDRVNVVESRIDVLAAKVGVYAALGATLGGAIAVAVGRLVLGG